MKHAPIFLISPLSPICPAAPVRRYQSAAWGVRSLPSGSDKDGKIAGLRFGAE